MRLIWQKVQNNFTTRASQWQLPTFCANHRHQKKTITLTPPRADAGKGRFCIKTCFLTAFPPICARKANAPPQKTHTTPPHNHPNIFLYPHFTSVQEILVWFCTFLFLCQIRRITLIVLDHFCIHKEKVTRAHPAPSRCHSRLNPWIPTQTHVFWGTF